MELTGEVRLKYQVTIFGDFSHILPSEEIIKICIGEFFASGLLPGNLQELDSRTNKMEPRLSLQSMRTGLNINFLSNRIDFLSTPMPGTPAASVSLASFVKEVGETLARIVSAFPISFSRMGFVVETFFRPIALETLDKLRRRLMSQEISLFPELPSVEWGVRNVVCKKLGGAVNQDVNLIYNISQVKVQMGDATGHREFETVHLLVDINLPSDKRLSVMPLESAQDFMAQAVELENSIHDSIAQIIYVE